VKTFLRKLKLSFLAMLCGWIACNIAWWIGSIPGMDRLEIPHITLSQRITAVMAIGIYTAIVITITWLLLFLPVDLCLSNDSKLRRPKVAALFGFLMAFLIVAAVFGYVAWFDGFWNTLDKAALPYALGTCVTGCVAGYVRARMDQPKPKATP